MLHYAHVLDGTVIDVSVWLEQPTEQERARYTPAVLIAATGSGCGPGWSYVDGVFAPPAPPTIYRYAATQHGWVWQLVAVDHELSDFERAAYLPRALVVCSDEVAVGWRYDEASGSFSAP